MAKRRPRSSARRPNLGWVWSDSHRLELLAYLGWCVEANQNFLKTAEDHLKSVTGKTFTRKQIEGKLRLEWRNRGQCPSFREVYEQGTAGFRLSDKDHQDLASIHSRLRPHRHELRASSVAIRTRSLAAPSTRKQARRAKTLATEFNTVTPEASLYSQESTADRSVGRNDASDVIEIPDSSSEQPTPPPGTRYAARPILRRRPQRSDPAPQAPGVIDTAREDVPRLKAQNLTLQNRVLELETELKEIRRCQETVDGELLSNYEKQLQALNAHRRNVTDFEEGILGLSEESIVQGYKALHEWIQIESEALCGPGSSSRVVIRNDARQPADSWAKKVSGWVLYPLTCHSSAKAIPTSRLVAALVGAGIFDLVFERVFPDVLAVECPLLDGYRNHILVKDGPEALYMADHSALKSLTPGDRFIKNGRKEEMVHEKAKPLSELMLSRLSSCCPPVRHQDNFLDDSDMEEPLNFEGSLSKALDLKFSLTTSMKRLKFYFFRPGKVFDDTAMEKDDMSSRSGVVKLCLLPALFSMPRNTQETGLERSRWETDSHYDRYLTEATEDETKSLRLVAKAVVFT